MSSGLDTSKKEIEDYILKEDIGEGNFGKVKLGISKTTGEKYAIKIINKEQIKKKMKNKIFRENEVITKFNHINVIFVFQIIEDPENYYIIMEYCKRGELFDYIVDHERLTEDEAAIFFYQLINGVEYIHSKGIAHRDLKPENLLLTKDKTLKIIDFGLSHEFDGIDLLKTKCGSPSYASPEILRGKPYDGFKSDVWCCGIILYAMVCGYLPFDGDTNKILFKNILKCEPEVPEHLNSITQDLIVRILTSDPDMRITIDEIKRHRFYLRGKKLCHIDYKMIEKNVLKKRRNKSSFKFDEDNNTYFIADNTLDYNDIPKQKQIISREEKIMYDIINEVKTNQKEKNKENINDNNKKNEIIEIKENKKDKKNERNQNKNEINNKEENNNIIIETINTISNKESSFNKNSKGNSLADLKNRKNISNNSNSISNNNSNKKNTSNNTNKVNSNNFRDSLLNDINKNNSKKDFNNQFKNINEMDAIFTSKRLNNNVENNFINNKIEPINTPKNDNPNNFLENSIKNNKFNQFLHNTGKNLHINTGGGDSKIKKIRFNNTEQNQLTLQSRSPDKIFMNQFSPTIVINGNNNINNNNNQMINTNNNYNNKLFSKIITGFNNNFFGHNYKKNPYFNNFKSQRNKNKNISNEHSNNIKNDLGLENEFNNNINKDNFDINSNNNINLDSIKNSNKNKNKIFKTSKSPDKLTLDSLHQLKLINYKQPSKEMPDLYYNNINININNYNIKQGKNKLNDNFMNYINTDNNQMKFKINKKHSITNLHNAKKLYLNTENNKENIKINENNDIYPKTKNNNYINITDENKEKSLPSKTQENFYKPKKHFNFDKISFHSSYNDNKAIRHKKSNIQFKKTLFGINKNSNNNNNLNDKLKLRVSSEGKSIKRSHLDNFLHTIAANGFYKNKKGNKKIYFCGPINIKVNNNNFNVNHNPKNQFLPIMFKK